MSRYVDIEPIIESIYAKWGGDPAYIANDTPTGIEARRDAELIEVLRSKPHTDIVRCAECEHYYKDHYFECVLRTASVKPEDFCGFGERRKANE